MIYLITDNVPEIIENTSSVIKHTETSDYMYVHSVLTCSVSVAASTSVSKSSNKRT